MEREQQQKAEEARRRDQETRENVIGRADFQLPWGLSDKAKQKALTETRAALAELPEGTPRFELDAAADLIVERYKRTHERRQAKERLIETALGTIYNYLEKLEREHDLEPAPGKTTWGVAEGLKPAIREALEEELEGDESPEQVAGLVRRLVREELS